MPLIKRKFTDAVGVLKNFGNKQTKIQKNKSFLFPDLQETMDATVVVEFIKISLSICYSRHEKKKLSTLMLL